MLLGLNATGLWATIVITLSNWATVLALSNWASGCYCTGFEQLGFRLLLYEQLGFRLLLR